MPLTPQDIADVLNARSVTKTDLDLLLGDVARRGLSVTGPGGRLQSFGLRFGVAGSAGPEFLPTDLPSLQLWLDPDTLGLADGAPVATEVDSSGHSRDATADGAAQPTYAANAQNGHPVLRFDGAANFLTFPAIPLPNGYTLVAVVRTTDDGIEGAYYEPRVPLITDVRQGVTTVGLGIGQGRALAFSDPGYFSGTLSVADGNAHLLVLRHAPNGWLDLRVDGVPDGSLNTPYRPGYVVQTIGKSYGDAWFAAADIADRLVFDGALSASDMDRVEGYLNAKLAIF